MTRTHALAIVILTLWIGWNLFMWFAATRSFSTVERVLKSPNPLFLRITQPLGEGQARQVLRYLASEINRTYFRAYGWAQVLLGLILFILVWRQSPRSAVDLGLAGLMLALALALTFVLTPWISSLGRSLDLGNPPPPAMHRFWMLHGAFTGLDGIKLLTGLVLLARWILLL